MSAIINKKLLASILFLVIVFTAVFVFPVFMVNAAGTDYYFSNSGDDNNTGLSSSSPWRNLAKIRTLNLLPGDRILLDGSSVFTDDGIYIENKSGTTALPIIITSYGTGKATVSAPGKCGVSIKNGSGFEIKNIAFKGNLTSSQHFDGFDIYTETDNASLPAHKILIENIEVSGYDNGVSVGAWTKNRNQIVFNGVTIQNVIAHHNKREGIITFGAYDYNAGWNWHFANVMTNLNINNCIAYENDGSTTKNGVGNAGSGIVVSGADGGIVENNLAYQNGRNFPNKQTGGPVGIWAYETKNIIFQYNESYGNMAGTNGNDGGGYDLDMGSVDCIMQYNYSHGNRGPGFMFCDGNDGTNPTNNNIIRYNISENDAGTNLTGWYAAIQFSDERTGTAGCTNSYFYNNTVYTNKATGFLAVIGGKSSYNIFNNIFVKSSGTFLTQQTGSNPTYRKNCYWSPDAATRTNMQTWITNSGQTDALLADPLLTNSGSGYSEGYRLKESSPCIDTGVNAAPFINTNTNCTTDFFGNKIPQNGLFDIGAAEYLPDETRTTDSTIDATSNTTINTNILYSYTVNYIDIDTGEFIKPSKSSSFYGPYTSVLETAANIENYLYVGYTLKTNSEMLPDRTAIFFADVCDSVSFYYQISGTTNKTETVTTTEITTVGASETTTKMPAIKGDINGDGKINGMDLLLMKQHILDIPGKEIESDTNAFFTADMNDDGKINGMDLLLLKKKILS